MEPLRYNEVSQEDIFDFVRCQRADGSFYGTSGTCRKGAQVGPKEKAALKKAAKAGNKKAEVALAVVEGKMTKAQAKKELGKAPAKKAEAVKELKPKKTTKKKSETEKEKPTKKKPAPKKAAEVKPNNKKETGADVALKERERIGTKAGRDAIKKETDVEVRGAYARQANAPSPKDISAKAEKTIFEYTRDDSSAGPKDAGFRGMNNCSRNPPSCNDTQRKANQRMDAAIREAPKNTSGGSYFRGMDLSEAPALAAQLENLKPGDTFTDPGFGSYSRSVGTARSFMSPSTASRGRNVFIESRSKKIAGIEEYSNFAGEQEGILPRGTSQTIRSVKHIGNTTYIEVD